MPSFRLTGIPLELAQDARQQMRSPQYGHPAHREVATGHGPCRLCLETFHVGQEERILFTYQPFQEPGSLPAPGPVFIHLRECRRYEASDLPPSWKPLPLVIEGFRRPGELVVRERVAGEVGREALERILEHPEVAYAHFRNAEAGCFMARAEPTGRSGA